MRFTTPLLLMSLLLGTLLGGREITDMLGRNVVVPAAPQKVYAPSPYGSYALYAMDPALLAGWIFTIDERAYPYLDPRMRTLPVLGRVFGPGQSANLEILLAQQPDLLLMWSHRDAFTQKEAERLRILNTPAVYAKDEALTDYAAIFRFLGHALGLPERGEALARYSENVFARAEQTLADIPQSQRPRVYYAEGLDGLSTECDDAIHVQLLKLAGDVNVHRCHTSNHKGLEKLSMETLLQYDPDVILVQEQTFFERIGTHPSWQHLRAVQKGQVYLIPRLPFNWFDRPPSFMRLLGLQWVMATLYPGQYGEDVRETTRAFYRLFLNVSLTHDQLTTILNGALHENRL
ncbi:ABC transporter substrate-binding protein [Sulfurimonas diazotrophicus]|uniref:ABC transporter substrate-binding protein n=1 Tax=Sulfurimonas diazotrophicus TaxID=3131939 RepID=A0ABZ3H9H2_9BACT